MLVEELREIQERCGYIPESELNELAARIGRPVSDIFGVASFYPHFRLKPPPKVSIHVCTDLPCHLKRSGMLKEEIEQLATGRTDVEIKSCSCLGQCDGAPAVLINDSVYARQTDFQMQELMRDALAGKEIEPQHFAPAKGPFKTDPYSSSDQHYGALRSLVESKQFAQVIDKIKDANLRGMGGGGFPAHIKWSTVRGLDVPEKYVVCNADESEVGTFKDREILKNLPHLLVEAMTICGLVVGATRGLIYIRHEYHEQIEILEAEIARANSMGLLGTFELSVFVSPGGYVQGEETALLEAIEGKRGQPRNKAIDLGLIKSAPAYNGLWGKPTVINNVETFIYVPAILIKGPDWFKSQGINGAQGLKWIGVGGQVKSPGVFEVPMGTPYSQAIKLAGGVEGGRALKAICPSGPSFGFLTPEQADTPIDFPARDKDGKPANAIAKAGTTCGSAAIIVIADGTDMVDVALNFTRFYRNESCGKCVPCRVGSQKMVDIIAGILAGTARDQDLDEINRLGEAMTMTSICGLGQVVHNPIASVLKHWRKEVEAYIHRNTYVSVEPQEPLAIKW